MKQPNILGVCVIIFFLLLAIGCSSSGNPVAPQETPEIPRDSSGTGHGIWYAFRVGLNPADGTASILPARDAEFHANITAFVKPPHCWGCVKIVGSSYYPGAEEWHLTVQVENGTIMAGYDVRGLGYGLGNKYVKNPDGFMNLYLSQDMDFKAFAKNDPVRGFWPGVTHQEKYVFHYPNGTSWASVDYIIDASWPGNCKEPIIEDIDFPTYLSNGYGNATLTVTAFDHQDPFFAVFADLSPIGGPPNMPMFDDGAHGDGDPDDGVYGITGIIAHGEDGQEYKINVYAYDFGFNYGWNGTRCWISGALSEPPVIDDITINRTTVTAGSSTEKISLECFAHDPDIGDELEYYWSCEGGDFDNIFGSTTQWSSPDTPGPYYINCEVTDGKGGFDDMDSDKIRVTQYSIKTPAPAPNFSCEKAVGGGSFSLSSYKPGNVVLITFWAVT